MKIAQLNLKKIKKMTINETKLKSIVTEAVNNAIKKQKASIFAEQNVDEQKAIQHYNEAIAKLDPVKDKKAIDVINEIISDELNHTERLNELIIEYGGVVPAKS